MLNELKVEGLGIIESAELSLDRGCSALTGETGAGKTLLVAALSLLLGGRADKTLVRTTADEARVEGRFSVPADGRAVSLLRDRGVLEPNDGDLERDAGNETVELIVSRTVPADGRSNKSRINGRLVTVGLLAEVGASLVEIAGQHEHQGLGFAARQRELLDAFGEAGDLADRVAGSVAEATTAASHAAGLRATERERRRELDILRYEIAEIEAADIAPGESERLRAEIHRLENAEAIASGLASAGDLLRGERGAEETVVAAASALRSASAGDPELMVLADRLETSGYEIADIAEEVSRRAVIPDPSALEEARARQSVLARLHRKYGEDDADVLAYLERVTTRAEELAGVEVDLDRLEEEATRLRKAAEGIAAELSDRRHTASREMAKAVEELLGDLALTDARFEIKLEPRELYAGGTETVEFLVTANAGETTRPVAKVASGGELSRIALALHLLTAFADASTMVFDEVDAGVGGRAAQAVGKALADVAHKTGAQVLVVTHLPQVAAFADRHYRIDKTKVDGRTIAAIEEVTGEERVAELSRMLAGLPKSERAREHAQELLDLARAGAV